jgi:hypothetical protein
VGVVHEPRGQLRSKKEERREYMYGTNEEDGKEKAEERQSRIGTDNMDDEGKEDEGDRRMPKMNFLESHAHSHNFF